MIISVLNSSATWPFDFPCGVSYRNNVCFFLQRVEPLGLNQKILSLYCILTIFGTEIIQTTLNVIFEEKISGWFFWTKTFGYVKNVGHIWYRGLPSLVNCIVTYCVVVVYRPNFASWPSVCPPGCASVTYRLITFHSLTLYCLSLCVI